ncbi:MAG TPA: GNAT family N-acetyltransferase [Stellaceae bacterium]|jgi:GNAT superfamily N-acetyltransferase|nr:GNAT family N-acetyltransferase [Stellaceae bacterium]
MTQSVIARRTIGGHLFEIDTAKDRLDAALIHDFLSRCSHWARGIPRETVERAIAHSLCFGLYRDGAQIGFARVVTDEATFAYLADVFVVADHRGAGIGQFLVEAILAHPPLQGLRRWLLVTRDAASLYRRCGFTDTLGGCTYLERFDPDIYQHVMPEKVAAE